MRRLKRKLDRFVCFLIGHRRMLRVGLFFGFFPNERPAAWTYCKRCGRLLKFYGSEATRGAP